MTSPKTGYTLLFLQIKSIDTPTISMNRVIYGNCAFARFFSVIWTMPKERREDLNIPRVGKTPYNISLENLRWSNEIGPCSLEIHGRKLCLVPKILERNHVYPWYFERKHLLVLFKFGRNSVFECLLIHIDLYRQLRLVLTFHLCLGCHLGISDFLVTFLIWWILATWLGE